MAIYEPNLRFSKAEMLAISILDALLARSSDQKNGENSGEDLVEISPSEARDLAAFLDDLRNSRKFRESAYFTEALADGKGLTDDRAKEIYLAWRTRHGRTRVASTFVWNEFVLRAGFGFSDNARMYQRPYRSPVTPMPLGHFLAMEVRLANSYGLSDQTTEIISQYYEKRLRLIDEVRKGDRVLPSGTVEQSASELADTFESIAKCSPAKSVTKARLAACTGLIMDIGAMFITRDWTATGVASVVGMSLPDLVGIE